MRFSMISIKLIAGIYAVLGTASALEWLYAVLFTGTRSTTPGLLDGLVPLGLAYGLVTYRPWARILGLVVAGFLGLVGVIGLLLCLGHVLAIHKAAGGSIVDRAIATLIILALFIAFAAWQWWVLTRPQVSHLFSSKPALG
jgi:hypothetical protein